MITEAGLAVYRSFDGDIDGLARVGTATQKALLSEQEWGVNDSLLQDLLLVEQGLVSAEYAAGLQQRLVRHCSSQEVTSSLQAMAQPKKPGRFFSGGMAKVRHWLGE